MSTRHCRHCIDGCMGATDIGMFRVLHGNGVGGSWTEGHCPACDEWRAILIQLRVLYEREKHARAGVDNIHIGVGKAIDLIAPGEA